MERIMMRHESVLFEKAKVDALTHEISKAPAPSKSYWNRIIIKGKEGFTFIQVQDIYWIEAYSDYVKFHTKEKFYLKNISMTEVEANLPPENFIRIHRSTIVNRNTIQGLHPHLNGEYFILLSNGQELKLSRSYKDKLRMLMEEKI
jgi:two-component system LytT family response regulator